MLPNENIEINVKTYWHIVKNRTQSPETNTDPYPTTWYLACLPACWPAWRFCFILSKIGFKNVTGGIDSHANVASACGGLGQEVAAPSCMWRVACVPIVLRPNCFTVFSNLHHNSIRQIVVKCKIIKSIDELQLLCRSLLFINMRICAIFLYLLTEYCICSCNVF